MLYPVRPGWYVNFGFWDVKRTREAHPPGHFNRMIEEKVSRARRHQVAVLGQLLPARGVPPPLRRRGLRQLEGEIRPGARVPGLYEKCVLKA